MSFNELKNFEDIHDFVRGVTFFGTGGGGRPEDGVAHLRLCLEEGISIKWMDVSEIDDDVWCCSVFGMGSIAPVVPTQTAPFGLKEKVIPYPMIEAVKKLSDLMSTEIKAVIPFELGGSNTPKAIASAIRMGAIVPDGDFCGRAVPELCQTTVAIGGESIAPIVICDDWGNHIIVKSVATLDAAEGIGKLLSTITKAPDPKTTCAHATFLMQVKTLKKYIVGNTLSNSFRVGKAIREARAAGKDPIAIAAENVGGKCIYRGKVEKIDWVSEDGYMIGTTYINGTGQYNGQTMEVWFKNENHCAKINGKVIVTSPDLICIIDNETGEPITNTKMVKDLNVAVITIPNLRYRTPKAIKALGPDHFGIKSTYTPVEQNVHF